MEIRIREASIKDRERIIAFLKETSPDDYIFYVLDAWLNDKNGKVLIAEHEDKVVAMNHFYAKDTGEGWLEGARVHKDYRGQGIATKLAEYSLNYLAKMNVKKARLVTNSKNIAAQKHLTRTPFKLVSRWIHPHYETQSYVEVEPWKNFISVENFLMQSQVFASVGRVLHVYYSWFDYNASFLKQRSSNGEVYFNGEELLIICPSHRSNNSMSISYLECNPVKLLDFFNIAYSLARKNDQAVEMLFMIPALDEYRNKLMKEKIDFSELLLYEAKIG